MSDVKLSNSNFLWLAKEQLYVPRNCTGCPTTPPLTSATWISPASYTLATKGPEGSFSPFTVTSTMWVPTSVGTNSTLWTPEACVSESHTIWHFCQTTNRSGCRAALVRVRCVCSVQSRARRGRRGQCWCWWLSRKLPKRWLAPAEWTRPSLRRRTRCLSLCWRARGCL